MRYTKRGRLRFTSHRDFQRAFERALRRAAVPMAYSAGFSPHPKVSYAGAAPTGVASEAEYLEIGLSQRCDPEKLRAALDASLPADLDVLEMVEVAPPPENTRAEGLADRLEASVWEVRLDGVELAVAQVAVTAFLAAERAEVSRMTKNGLRTFDAREAVVALSAGPGPRAAGDGAAPCAILRLVVRHVTPAVRPDDVLAGLASIGALAPPETPAVTRLAQGPLDELAGTVSDPLAPDRDAAGAR
jgi:radical SAM-linked protein